MTYVYLVRGSRGEDVEDYGEWIVAAYLDASKALEHRNRLLHALESWFAKTQEERVAVTGAFWKKAPVNALDPVNGFSVDPYNERYWVDDVELLEEVPT